MHQQTRDGVFCQVEAQALNAERVVAIGLNQAGEEPQVEIAHPRLEPDIHAAVLGHIAEIAVALRVILGGHRPGGKRFVVVCLPPGDQFEEHAEANQRRQEVDFVGLLEFEHDAVFVHHANCAHPRMGQSRQRL